MVMSCPEEPLHDSDFAWFVRYDGTTHYYCSMEASRNAEDRIELEMLRAVPRSNEKYDVYKLRTPAVFTLTQVHFEEWKKEQESIGEDAYYYSMEYLEDEERGLDGGNVVGGTK